MLSLTLVSPDLSNRADLERASELAAVDRSEQHGTAAKNSRSRQTTQGVQARARQTVTHAQEQYVSGAIFSCLARVIVLTV